MLMVRQSETRHGPGDFRIGDGDFRNLGAGSHWGFGGACEIRCGNSRASLTASIFNSPNSRSSSSRCAETIRTITDSILVKFTIADKATAADSGSGSDGFEYVVSESWALREEMLSMRVGRFHRFHDQRRIFKTVWMVIRAWLQNDLHLTAECEVALFDNRGVFEIGDSGVGIPADA